MSPSKTSWWFKLRCLTCAKLFVLFKTCSASWAWPLTLWLFFLLLLSFLTHSHSISFQHSFFLPRTNFEQANMTITCSKTSLFAVVLVLATSICVNAHGQVHHVIANGVTNNGPNVSLFKLIVCLSKQPSNYLSYFSFWCVVIQPCFFLSHFV